MATNTPTTAPAKVNTAKQTSTRTAIKGLMSELNSYQEKLVKSGTVEVADIYEIAFVPAELAQSSMVKSFYMNVDWSTTAMQDGESAAAQRDPDTQSGNIKTRTWSINAGTQIVQVIDMIMRNSTYISDQARVFIDEDSQDVRPQKPLGNLAWYKISVFATPLKMDNKRNDYAYRIKFVISAYGINSMQSEYFPSGNFRGVHKNYDYWFTGNNTQVIDFEQEFNYAYHLNLSQSDLPPELKKLVDTREKTPMAYTGTNEESSQGAKGRANEIGASAASYLYSPKDQGNVKLRIIGDPAWLQQGECAFGVTTETFTQFSPFNKDGTINFDSYQILFRINWNRATDYDLSTGLAATEQVLKSGPPRESATYIAKEVISTFRGGKFEQQLEGKLLLLPVSAADQAASDQTRNPSDSRIAALQIDNALARPVGINSAAEVRKVENLLSETSAATVLKATPELLPGNLGQGVAVPKDAVNSSMAQSVEPAAEPQPAVTNPGTITYDDVGFSPPARALGTVASTTFVPPPVLPAAGEFNSLAASIGDKFTAVAGKIFPAQIIRKDQNPG
jgi:hypothetical protein